jgi:hypothetical protein
MNGRFWLNEIVTGKNLPHTFSKTIYTNKKYLKNGSNKCNELLINSQYFKKRKELAAVGTPIQRKGQEIEFTNTH